MLYTIKDYSQDPAAGAAEARQEANFLFKAFETGQVGPRRLARLIGEKAPRSATIHEYLDWTVTAYEAQDDAAFVSDGAEGGGRDGREGAEGRGGGGAEGDTAAKQGGGAAASIAARQPLTFTPPAHHQITDKQPQPHQFASGGRGVEQILEANYDFSGFRVVLLYPRDRNAWPAPGASKPGPRADARLGAPADPWPALAAKGRPLSAATIRAGPGYLEVPFVATQ